MKPYIITHMASSLDGRIVTKNWGKVKGLSEYERIHKILKGDAWMVGRVTMEMHFAKGRAHNLKPSKIKIDRTDFVAFHESDHYAISIDESGKLHYKSGAIDGDHLIVVLAEKVTDDYLQFLRQKGISYVFGGANQIDFKIVMDKLRRLFHIKRLLLEGGGGINGSVLASGLVDEISMLQFPVVDGIPGTPTAFDSRTGKGPIAALKLISAKRVKDGVVWSRYKVIK